MNNIYLLLLLFLTVVSVVHFAVVEDQQGARDQGLSATTMPKKSIQKRLRRQQYRWCLKHKSFHGFQMQNGNGNCWSPGRKMIITLLNSTSVYRDQYEIQLKPLEFLANQKIRIVGDSISRFFATALYYVLLQEQAGDSTIEPVFHWTPEEFHGVMIRHIAAPANITLEWYWAPTAREVVEFLEELYNNSTDMLESAHHNIIGIGNHQRGKVHKKWIRQSYLRLNHLIKSSPLANVTKDLVVQTAPRHAPEHPGGLPNLEQDFNSWWARLLSETPALLPFDEEATKAYQRKNRAAASAASPLQMSSHPVAVLNGFWPMEVEDQDDGTHSITHAYYSAFMHLWRWQWMYLHDNKGKGPSFSFKKDG